MAEGNNVVKKGQVARDALRRFVLKEKSSSKSKVAGFLANIMGIYRRSNLDNPDKQNDLSDADSDGDSDEDNGNQNSDEQNNRSLPDIEVLRTFSPLIVHHQVYSSNPAVKLHPSTRTHYGAVLFADISGFTRLANLLSVEQLQLHISKYFKMLFDCVERYCGDILKICGDAIMIFWPLDKDSTTSTIEERTACALVASLCGRDMIQSCGTYTAVHGEHRISLSLHCGVGVADVQCYWVGKGGRWEFLISGDALAQIASTEPEAKSGEIVVSPQVFELVCHLLDTTQTLGGNYLLTNEIKIGEAVQGTSTSSAGPQVIPGLSDHPTLNFEHYLSIATSMLFKFARSDPVSLRILNERRRSTAIGLQYYVHNSARTRLQHLGKDFQMAELREVVTLFVNITGLEEDFRLKRLDVIQNVMAVIVDSHKCFGGTLRQFVVDDKGCVAIGALGVQHHTFEDNAARGVEIASLIRMNIKNMGKNCSIGISKGDAFCGLVGSDSRREYAMMGSCVNLAARLMCSCEPGTIVVDERVHEAASGVLLFEDMGTVNAKGYAEPVPIFMYQQTLLTPNSRLIALCNSKSSQEYRDCAPFGRKAQLDSLLLDLRNFMDGSPGCQQQFHLLEGEEGIGKTALCEEVVRFASSRGACIIAALCLESYSKRSYWLIAQLLERIMTVCDLEAADKTSAAASSGGKSQISPASSTVAPLRRPSSVYTPPAAAGAAAADADATTGSWTRSRRFKEWAAEHLAYTASPRGNLLRTMIHGYPITDIVDLIGGVFHEVIPNASSAIETISKKQKDLLLKTMLVRVLKVAFAHRHRIFLLENLCKADIASAAVISDFMGSSEVAFGIITFRRDSVEYESGVIRGIRSNAYVVSLAPLKARQAVELVANILGPLFRSFLSKENIARIYSRTQGNPGLLEALANALLSELENGRMPTIDNLRTPGQQSIIQKVDLVDPPLQLLLKTAAAIGIVFSLRGLQSVYNAMGFASDELPLNIDRLVDLGLFVAVDFKPVSCTMLTDDVDDKFVDTPEIGAQALPWYDARGMRRRGIATISADARKRGPTTPDSRKRVPVPAAVGDEAPTMKNTFFRFSHPSIQSTAYALSLELDRIPVHTAFIRYLSEHFSHCPGVEEACLYHALHTKSTHIVLVWLTKCALAAKATSRHALFTQRATQLLSLLIRGESRTEAEVDQQTFQMCRRYSEKFAMETTQARLVKFTYEYEGSALPNWSKITSDSECCLLTIGGVMRDMMCAFVKVGDLFLVSQLAKSSEEILRGVLVERVGASSERDDMDSPTLMRSYRALTKSRAGNQDVDDFESGTTESIVASFVLPLLSNDALRSANLGGWLPKFVRSSYIHVFVNGQEALAVMHILRGNAPAAFAVLDESINIVHGSCTPTEPCHVLQAICLPRLYALRSCCSPLEGKARANRSLIKAELWLSKSKEDNVATAVSQYHACVRPRLQGLGDLHSEDNGEWVLMVVVALRLCGEGKWDGALEEFEGAMAELKEINDKTTLLQVRILHAWALFMMGDIAGFHNKMRTIKQYTDQVEEPLTGTTAGELLSFRFSLSCFYDASEVLVAKLLTATSASAGIGHAEEASLKRLPSDLRMSFQSQPHAADFKNAPMSLYQRVTETFLATRSRPMTMEMPAMIDICNKISRRIPCHYLGGMYIFFCGMAAIATYEHQLEHLSEGQIPTKSADLAPFISAIESEVPLLANLFTAIWDLLAALEIQARGYHPILLYFFRSLKLRVLRMRGDLDEAARFAILDHRCSSETTPLAVAFLKMEIALYRQAAHNEKLTLSEKRENLSSAITIAKEAQGMFSIYEADIEIAILKRCIADCEDLIRAMMPVYTAAKGSSNMTARAYWLDLSCEDDSDDDLLS